MMIYFAERWTTVAEAPVGLLQLENGTFICKSEYSTGGSPDCIIVDSGERYCGGYDQKCKSVVIK